VDDNEQYNSGTLTELSPCQHDMHQWWHALLFKLTVTEIAK